jgi:hypothetical protein
MVDARIWLSFKTADFAIDYGRAAMSEISVRISPWCMGKAQ